MKNFLIGALGMLFVGCGAQDEPCSVSGGGALVSRAATQSDPEPSPLVVAGPQRQPIVGASCGGGGATEDPCKANFYGDIPENCP